MTARAVFVGRLFGRLSVISEIAPRDGDSRKRRRLSCLCECGTKAEVSGDKLGRTLSCGCLSRETASICNSTHGERRSRKRTAEYRTWCSMRERCENPNVKAYKYYGGRGIKVCDRWQSFESFLSDMGRKPSAQHSIERENNNGNYEPGNCRWATQLEQAGNKRNCRMVALEETDISLTDFCRRLDLNYGTVHMRLQRGQSLEQALWGR